MLTIFEFVCQCLTVKKSGNPWWALFVPFYSTYVCCKMGKKPKLFWIYLPLEILIYLVSFAALFLYMTFVLQILAAMFYAGAAGSFAADEILSYIEEATESGIIPLPVIIVLSAVTLLDLAYGVLELILRIAIAKAFGKSGWFGVGLLLIPVVFWAILAFDSSVEYLRDGVPANNERDFAT